MTAICPECRLPVTEGEGVARVVELPAPGRGRNRAQTIIWHPACKQAADDWAAKVAADAEQERAAMLAALRAEVTGS